MLNIKCQSETDKIEHDRIRRSTKKLIKQSKKNFEVSLILMNSIAT